MSRFITPRVFVNPYEVADETLTRSGQPRLDNGCAIDLEHIIRNYCGLELMYIDGLNPSGKPLLGLFAPAINAIMVENNCNPVRQRFTIAHEIGHYALEHDHGSAASLFDLGNPEMFECTEDDEKPGAIDELKTGLRRRKEIRANQFASRLLMPDGLVKEIWQKEARDVSRVAACLMVSRESLGYRIQELKLS